MVWDEILMFRLLSIQALGLCLGDLRQIFFLIFRAYCRQYPRVVQKGSQAQVLI